MNCRKIYSATRNCRTFTAILLACSSLATLGQAQEESAIARPYALVHRDAAQMVEPVKAALAAARLPAEIAFDPATNRLHVRGSEQAHRIVMRVVESLDRPAQIPADQPPRQPAGASGSASYTLKHVTTRHLETAFWQIWGQRIQPPAEQGPRVWNLQMTSGVVAIDVTFDTGELKISGPQEGITALLRVIHAVDSPRDGSQTAVLPVQKADAAGVRKTVTALLASHPAQSNVRALPAGNSGQAEATLVRRPGTGWGGQLVAHLFQPPGPDAQPEEQPPAGEEPADGEEPPAGEEPPGEEAPADDEDPAGGLIGPVQIEFLEGLDVIVIRGNKRDVARVTKIIEDIERLSAATQPVIEVLPLEHARSEPLAELVIEVYTQVLSPRQGQVSITPLGKPNALLLIGREESVLTVVDLVKKLDQPVKPTSQFGVFRLKHLSAVDAVTTITEFYTERAGLGPRVQAIAEYRTNAVIVFAGPRDLQEIGALLNRLDVPAPEASNELRVFQLQNSLAEELAPVLQSAILGQGQGQPGQPAQGGTAQLRSAVLTFTALDTEGGRLLKSGILNDVRITADTQANALLVNAPPESMELIAALIQQLDRLPMAEAQIKVFTIINGDATSLTEMLQALFGQAQGGGGGGFGQQGGLQLPTAGGDGSLVTLRFAVDQRTNSIIATGTRADLTVVEAILLRLDESDVRQRKTNVFRLRNSPALDVATAINELLRSEREVQNLAPQGVSPFEQIEREVVVVPEPVSNSLIVSATPRYFDEIKRIVDELDARPPMVMIQVMIAEVVLGFQRELGVELGLQDSLLFDRGIANLMPGFNFNNFPLGNNNDAGALATREKTAGQALSTFALGRVNSELGYGGLVLSANSESINILVRALEDEGRGQILSRPQIMTLDNQPAFIQIGQRVPRITSTQVVNGGTINNTVLENVGILLGVTPRISPEGLVVMEIDAERSRLGNVDAGIPISINVNGDVIRSPIIDTITAQTTVSARSGQTVILGGLITGRRETRSSKVPVLGDVPILGALFRYDAHRDDRSELLIIMTPYIVRGEEDVQWLNYTESQRMSWCLADVVEMHGDSGLTGGSSQWGAGESPVIFPDENPTGWEELPSGEVVPPVYETPEFIPGPVPEALPPSSRRPLPPVGSSEPQYAAPANPSYEEPRVQPVSQARFDAVPETNSNWRPARP